MHRIIEQAGIFCGMVKTPNPYPSAGATAAQMQSITLTSKERKDLIVRMKRQRKPSHRLRMHIVLLAADGHRPTRIARILYCSRTTVYKTVERFVAEGQAAFDGRKRRGPQPLLDESANERIERLVEEDLPAQHGWLRSRWSWRAAGCGVVQGTSASGKPGDGSPRAA